MASVAAQNLRTNFIKEDAESFEPLTFGELKVGERFITFPSPGHNAGHGGFRGTSYIFEKTQEEIKRTELGMSYGILTGLAVGLFDKAQSTFPHAMLVLRVQ